MPSLEITTRPRFRVPYTDFPSQFVRQRQELLAAVERVLQRGDFILGKEVEEFERAFADLCGVRHAVSVANGTDALILGLKALGIGAGDEVITPPNSWISSTSSIVLAGARPVFADVTEEFTLDPVKVEAAITPRTKAIMPVHLTGRCADMEAINTIAARHGVAIIEDAAQAVGAHRGGQRAGASGTLGCFSLHPLKNLNGAGDGGMVTTQSDELAHRLRLLRNHGLRTRDEVVTWGYNSRLDTMQAAILLDRLAHLPQVIETRRRHAARYRQALAEVVTCPAEGADEYATYHLFMIQAERRDALVAWLTERGVDTRIHYPTPIHLQPCSASLGYRHGQLPCAEAQAGRILSLPIQQELSEEQVDYAARAIVEFYQRVG